MAITPFPSVKFFVLHAKASSFGNIEGKEYTRYTDIRIRACSCCFVILYIGFFDQHNTRCILRLTCNVTIELMLIVKVLKEPPHDNPARCRKISRIKVVESF